jgi:GNAT superfamily N-acetyltransferase
MNIAAITVDELPSILPCADEFCKVLNWPLSGDKFLGFLSGLITRERGVVITAKDEAGVVIGGVGGKLDDEPISGQPVAVEIFWFVTASHRGGTLGIRLLLAFEKWAKEQGAAHVCMVKMENSMPEAVDKIYQRLGYRKLETTYIK